MSVEIKLSFVGDIMLSRGVANVLNKKEQSTIVSSEIVDILGKSDLSIGNLECPISVNSEKKSATSFKASPTHLKYIKDFDLFSLANNHIFDCGKSGANETVDHLREYNFRFTGLDFNKSKSHAHYSIKDKSITFLSCAVNACIKDNEEEIYPKATKAETDVFINDLNTISQNSLAVVLVHGGNEMIRYPQPSFRYLCKSYIDAGARIVISNHPHVLGCYEEYKDGFIFYSLGDFIFDGQNYSRRRSAILNISLVQNKIDWSIQPTQINDDLTVSLIKGSQKTEEIQKFHSRSRNLQSISYDKNYRRLYLKGFLEFQIDRLIFKYKTYGIRSVIQFMISKMGLTRHYLRLILKNRIK